GVSRWYEDGRKSAARGIAWSLVAARQRLPLRVVANLLEQRAAEAERHGALDLPRHTARGPGEAGSSLRRSRSPMNFTAATASERPALPALVELHLLKALAP